MQFRFVPNKLPYQQAVDKQHQESLTNSGQLASIMPMLNIHAIESCNMKKSPKADLKIYNSSPLTNCDAILTNYTSGRQRLFSEQSAIKINNSHSLYAKPQITTSTQQFVVENVKQPQKTGNVHKLSKPRRGKNKLNRLVPLHALLTNVFLGRSIDINELNIDKLSLNILVELMIRKNREMAVSRLGREVSVDDIYGWVCQFQHGASNKRVEENIKFIFKLTLKHLRNEFFKANNLNVKAEESNALFYKHYFAEEAKKRGTSIQAYVDPLKYVNIEKTLNIGYISNIFHCQHFKTDFEAYLTSGNIKNSYRKAVPSKLTKVLCRFEVKNKSKERLSENENIHIARMYFRYNKQCKLPWTEQEIDEAIDSMLQLCKGRSPEQ